MEWRDVVDYEGYYLVSENGDIRSMSYVYLIRKSGIEDGYRRIMLLKKGKRKNHKVHKLVYEAFVGKIPEGCDVHHLDNNKLNNHFSNLEIVEMSKHRSLHFTGENNPRATLTQQEVDEIRKRYKQETIKQIADSLGISYRNIHRIVRGNRWK